MGFRVGCGESTHRGHLILIREMGVDRGQRATPVSTRVQWTAEPTPAAARRQQLMAAAGNILT